MFELMQCEKVLLEEIADKRMKQKDIAQTYALALRSRDEMDWRVVNKAIVERWSHSGLEHIKKMAWSGGNLEMISYRDKGMLSLLRDVEIEQSYT